MAVSYLCKVNQNNDCLFFVKRKNYGDKENRFLQALLLRRDLHRPLK